MSEALSNVAIMVDVGKLPVEKAVARLIDHSVKIGASDLFLLSNEQHVAAQVKHLGTTRTISIIPSDVGRKCLAHVKAAAGMDLSEKRRPLDGRWIYDPEEGEIVDLRINQIPTMYGEDLAMRLLVRGGHLFNIENLGMNKDQLNKLENMLESPSGLILVSGPTGSGKTATLYASLVKLNDGKRKINTIEDPIEYSVDGLRQSQIHPAINLGWPELLKSVLRQSPDVIMIGEVRDPDTADIAVRAANSGHLVFATIHSATAAGAVQSMKALGSNPHFLSTGLRGVVAQRLVRTFCPKCKIAFDLSDAPDTFEEIKSLLAPGEGHTLYAPKGCDACNHLGYSGRSGVFETMTVGKSIRNLIAEGRPAREVHDQAIKEGMVDFRRGALLKVAQGLTSTEEVFRVIPTEHLLLDD